MVSQQLLHSAKELGRLPVAELLAADQLLEFALLRGGRSLSQFLISEKFLDNNLVDAVEL